MHKNMPRNRHRTMSMPYLHTKLFMHMVDKWDLWSLQHISAKLGFKHDSGNMETVEIQHKKQQSNKHLFVPYCSNIKEGQVGKDMGTYLICFAFLQRMKMTIGYM